MLDKYAEKFLYWGLGLVLFMPILLGRRLIFPLITTKTYFFYILVDILFIIYLFLLTKKKLYPKKSTLLYMFLGLSGVKLIIDLFGINALNSFWGNYERMMGGYTLIHLTIYLWMLLAVYNTPKKYIRLLDVSVFVSFLMSIYALLEKFQVSIPYVIQSFDARVQGTLGNAAFLASFLLIHVFLSAFLLAKRKDSYWSIWYGIVCILNLTVLFFTGTRGALVGLFFGLIGMVSLILFRSKNKKVGLLAAGVVGLVLLSAISLFSMKDSSFVQSSELLRRVSSFSISEGTGYNRLLLWKMSIGAMKDRPLLGYGGNNIRIPLDKHHDYRLEEEWYDSSHSQFFDELLAHGVVGFLFYISFLVLLMKNIVQAYHKNPMFSIFFTGLFTSYIIQSFFIFDSIAVSFIFFSVLGFVLVTIETDTDTIKRLLPKYVSYPLMVLLVMFLSVVYLRSIPVAAKVLDGYRLVSTNPDAATETFLDADQQAIFGYDIIAPSMAEGYVEVFKQRQKFSKEQFITYIEAIEKIYKHAEEKSNGYSKFQMNLAKMYQLAGFVSPEYSEKSTAILEELIETAPTRVDPYYALAQEYYNKDDFATAEKIMVDALKFEAKHGRTYRNLAQMRLGKGDPILAADNIIKAHSLGGMQDTDYGLLEKFSKMLVEKEDWDRLLQVLFIMNDVYPETPYVYSNISVTYKKMGNEELNKEWKEKTKSLIQKRGGKEKRTNFLDL